MLKGQEPSAGEIPGLSQAMLEALRAWRPGELGVCVIEPAMQVTLVIPEWCVYGWADAGQTPNLDIGESDPVVVFTVPLNERAYLDSYSLQRSGGDNNIQELDVVFPAGYVGGDGRLQILYPTTPNTLVYWPDPGGQQTISRGTGNQPILMEPGTEVRFIPNGSGSGNSSFQWRINMRRWKLTRAMEPE